MEQATLLKPKEVWEEVSAWLLSQRPHRLDLYLALQGWYAQIVGADVALAWAEEYPAEGPRLVAAFTQVFGDPMDRLPRELLIRYGRDEKVTSALYANFGSGSYWGNTSNWLEGQKKAALAWIYDPHPAVRAWAQRLIESLDKQIQEWRQVEEESRF